MLCLDGKAAWGVQVNGMTPFGLAKMAGTAEALQERLTSTITAIHRAQEEAYLQTLEEVRQEVPMECIQWRIAFEGVCIFTGFLTLFMPYRC